MEHRLQHFSDIAVFLQERLRHALHQRVWRTIRNKAHGQLAGNERSRRGMVSQNVENLAALLLSAGFDAMPKHVLVAGVMHAFLEDKAAALPGLFECPPREDSGYLGNVFLGI